MDKPKPKFRPLNILTKPPVKSGGQRPVTAMAKNGLQGIGGKANALGGVASIVGQLGAIAGSEQLANTGNIASGVLGTVGGIADEFAKRRVDKTTPKLRKGAKGIGC